jgi:hypothetical protein
MSDVSIMPDDQL